MHPFFKNQPMQIKTLKNLPVEKLTYLFNEAFADYFVKITLTPEILTEKIHAEDVLLDKSVGVFSDEKPVGFVLHAVRTINGEKVAYNAGTGIIPEFRGNNLTVKMYKYILPALLGFGVKKVVLEVMEQNLAAIKSYSKVGFEKSINLECFKGKIQNKNINKEITLKKESNDKILKLNAFWDWQPSWQHANRSVVQSNLYKTFFGYLNESLVCYASIIPKTGRVAQFAVHPNFRKTGIGTSLFIHLSKICPKGISLINIDGRNDGTIKFLKKMGLNNFLRQYKMELKLNKA